MKKTLIILLAVLSFVISGCEIQTITNGGEQTDTLTSTETTEPELIPYPITIGGVEISESPAKVVCLSPSITEIVYELGYGDRLIGRGSYSDYPPVVLKLPEVGSSAKPDFDAIIALAPDVVLTGTAISTREQHVLERAGIKTLVLPAPTTLQGFREIYQALGLLFEGAFTGAEKGEQTFSPVAKACSNSGVVYIGKYVYITQNLAVAGGNTLESAIFSCFGVNAAETGVNYAYDVSQLLENQPELILLNDIYTLDDLLAHELFSQLDAVMNNRVIYIDNAYFERPTARIVDMIVHMIDEYRKF